MPPKPSIWRAASSCPGWPRSPGRGRARRAGCSARKRGDRVRVLAVAAPSGAPASSGRAGRASSRTAPGRHRATSAGTSGARRSVGSFVAAKPPITSEWPPRYFVVEWTTMSAPSSSGRWRYGVANVLSTTTRAPAACAASAASRMSTTFRSGFVGVSSQTMRVLLVEVRSQAGSSIVLGGDEREVGSPWARRPARTCGSRRRRRRSRRRRGRPGERGA